MNKLIASVIICVLLLVACAVLAFWNETSYRVQISRTGHHLEERLEELEKVELALKETEGRLQKLNQQNTSLAERIRGLNAGILSLKETIADIQKAKDALAAETQRVSSEKERLQSNLTEVILSAKEQIGLKEREFERESREKVDFAKEEFLTQKKVFLKQIEATETILKNLSRKNEGLLGELTRAGELMEKLHREKEIVEENERLLAELDENKEVLSRLHRAKEELAQQFKQDENQFEKDTLKFHYNLALAYDENRQYKKALAEYKKALKIAPDDPDVHYNLGVIYDEHIYDNKKAIEHYQAYLNLCPDAEDVHTVVSWIKKAEEELEFE